MKNEANFKQKDKNKFGFMDGHMNHLYNTILALVEYALEEAKLDKMYMFHDEEISGLVLENESLKKKLFQEDRVDFNRNLMKAMEDNPIYA